MIVLLSNDNNSELFMSNGIYLLLIVNSLLLLEINSNVEKLKFKKNNLILNNNKNQSIRAF